MPLMRGTGSAFLAIVVMVFAIVAAPAGSVERVRMQASINPDGSGHLFVNSSGSSWSWETCARDLTACTPFGSGREIDTTGASPGIVFRVEGSDGARGVSPEWRGRLKPMTPPKAVGVVRANEFIAPMPAAWTGGWKGEFSALQLAACTTPTGEGCTTLTDPHYVRNCSTSASFVVDARFAGSYLRIADEQLGAGPIYRAAFAVTSPYTDEVWKGSRSTAVAMVGQIAPAVSSYPGECGPPPPNAAAISGQGVALIDCRAGCQAALIASHKGRRARIVRTLPAQAALFFAPSELRMPRKALAALGTGSIRFVVKVDGKQVAQRSIECYSK